MNFYEKKNTNGNLQDVNIFRRKTERNVLLVFLHGETSYTQRNMGKFVIAETKAPNGYFGDWTNIDHPGTANTPLGKRGYYIEITEDKDNSVIWLDNADYNADIAVTDMGGTKLVTSAGVETTVTIYDTAKDPRRTYNTDNSGKAANEDNYSSAVNSICQTVSGKFKNPNIEGTIFFGLAFKVQCKSDCGAKWISAPQSLLH